MLTGRKRRCYGLLSLAAATALAQKSDENH
jgi:hypothetical protein